MLVPDQLLCPHQPSEPVHCGCETSHLLHQDLQCQHTVWLTSNLPVGIDGLSMTWHMTSLRVPDAQARAYTSHVSMLSSRIYRGHAFRCTDMQLGNQMGILHATMSVMHCNCGLNAAIKDTHLGVCMWPTNQDACIPWTAAHLCFQPSRSH